MTTVVDRDSVCMGDDVEGHSMEISISDTDTFTSLFKRLLSTHFFASIYGNNVVWTLMCGDDDLISYLTRTERFYTRFMDEKEPTINSVRRWKGQKIFSSTIPQWKSAQNISFLYTVAISFIYGMKDLCLSMKRIILFLLLRSSGWWK